MHECAKAGWEVLHSQWKCPVSAFGWGRALERMMFLMVRSLWFRDCPTDVWCGSASEVNGVWTVVWLDLLTDVCDGFEYSVVM